MASAKVSFPPIADASVPGHCRRVRRKPWGLIYGLPAVIFFGGLLFGVERSRYFPIFVVFCMAYGAAATALMMWPDRRSPKG